MSVTEVLQDATRRVFYAQSYDLPQVAKTYNNPQPSSCIGAYVLYIGPGTVLLNGVSNITWTGGYYGPFIATIVQVYVDPTNGSVQQVPVTQANMSTFPVGSLPICVVHTDSVGRISAVDDYRPH